MGLPAGNCGMGMRGSEEERVRGDTAVCVWIFGHAEAWAGMCVRP